MSIRDSLADGSIVQSMTILESVDTEGIADLEAKLVEAVPQEF